MKTITGDVLFGRGQGTKDVGYGARKIRETCGFVDECRRGEWSD